jgi:TRAP-type mannitol/chloroaromatic compound transport system permease small subunit
LGAIIRFINGISEWAAKIAMWALCIVTLIVVLEVLTRRVFHSPHVWTYEIITFFYGAHFMLLAAYALLKKGHVAIDILYNNLKPKTQATLDVISYVIFFFPFMIVLFKMGASLAIDSWAAHETTLTARLPIILPAMKTITPVTAVLLFFQGLAIFYQRIYFLVKGEEFKC